MRPRPSRSQSRVPAYRKAAHSTRGHRPPTVSHVLAWFRGVIALGLLASSATLLVYASAGATPVGRPQAIRAEHIPGVGIREVIYVDHTRSTFNYLTGISIPERRLPTEIRYPSSQQTSGERRDARALDSKARYPVIIFAEGYAARPDLYAPLLDAWVRAGFVVVSPEFPDTTFPNTEPPINAGYPHGSPENDLVNEPGDISFVIAQLTKAASHHGFLWRLLRLRDIFLAGQSDGAAVVDAYAYDARYSSIRMNIRGIAVFAGYEIAGDESLYRKPVPHPAPALVVQSTTDTCNEPNLSVELYNDIPGAKYFLKITGATHLGPFDGTDPLAFVAVRNMTLRFFSHILYPNRVSSRAVIKAGTLPSVAFASQSQAVPPIPTPVGSPYCAPAY